ncbi:MAG: winged helix-turn-helix domain-containing protein [Robiginitomaculum sp.]|nr:winged helix-turn-helix domain-containing protein [Robiginitomaculum sp.]
MPRNRLVLGAKAYPLEPQIMNVLCVLAEKPGKVFLRDDLIDRIWKVEYGGDESLSRAISVLRKTFKKAGDDDLYIETIYKRGYRLKASVSQTVSKVDKKTKDINTENEISIAVLAFEDMSRDHDQQYFSDGISEEIINALVKLPYLRVTGRTSSFSFKGKNISICDIASALNVSHILEGSVRKHGEQLRITVQLIDAAKDKHIWSDTFDGVLDDIFTLQEKIARAVERELNAIFSTTDKTHPDHLTTAMTKNLQAYDFFIHGRGLTQQQDGLDILPRAIEMLEKSVSIDPKFSQAWAYLARANFYSLEHTKAPDWAGNIVAGRRAVGRALALDPDLDIAQSTRGYLALLDLKIGERLVACEKAYQLNPNSPIFRYTFGSALASIGQSERGLALMETATTQEPLSASWINGIGHPKFALGDFDGADADYQHSLDLGYDGAMFMKAILLNHRHGPNMAIEFLQANTKHMGSLSKSMASNSVLLKLYIRACYAKSKLARWLIFPALRYTVMNKKTQPAAGLSFRCYALGYPKLFMKAVRNHPHPYMGAVLAQLWTPAEDAKRIRTHKDFPKFADDIGLVRAWQVYGWPNMIKPVAGTDGSDGQFICT